MKALLIFLLLAPFCVFGMEIPMYSQVLPGKSVVEVSESRSSVKVIDLRGTRSGFALVFEGDADAYVVIEGHNPTGHVQERRDGMIAVEFVPMYNRSVVVTVRGGVFRTIIWN